MSKKTIQKFSLIEILIVLSIFSILAGMLLPSLMRAKQKAKEVRWLAFNSLANRDGDTVLNYNFMYDDYTVRSGALLFPALRNGGIGCTLTGFDPKDYDGLIEGAYEWRRGGGRWNGYNNALQFDSLSTIIRVPGDKILSFNPSDNDFTAMMWFCIDNLNSPQTLFSKSEFPASSQCELTISKSKIDATVGGITKSWEQSLIQEGKWMHIAMVSLDGVSKVFINGNDLDAPVSEKLAFLSSADCIPLASINGLHPIQVAANSQGKNTPASSGSTVAPPSGATTQGQGNAYGITGGNSGQGNSGNVNPTSVSASKGKFLIGATGLLNGGTSLNFGGRMDEFIFVRRALPQSEIRGHWQMGNPY